MQTVTRHNTNIQIRVTQYKIDGETVQVSIVTGDPNATRLLGDTDDRTRHGTDRRTYKSHAEHILTCK